MKQGKESDRATLQWLGRVSGKNKKYIVLEELEAPWSENLPAHIRK